MALRVKTHVICKITDTGVTAIQEDRSIVLFAYLVLLPILLCYFFFLPATSNSRENTAVITRVFEKLKLVKYIKRFKWTNTIIWPNADNRHISIKL